MAERLVRGGLDTTVYDLVEPRVRALAEAGAKPASSPSQLAAACDVVGVCVRDDDDVRRVVTDADGLLAGLAPGSVIAVHSTILPSTVREVGAIAAAAGVGVVDACITGGQAGAEQGTLNVQAVRGLRHDQAPARVHDRVVRLDVATDRHRVHETRVVGPGHQVGGDAAVAVAVTQRAVFVGTIVQVEAAP